MMSIVSPCPRMRDGWQREHTWTMHSCGTRGHTREFSPARAVTAVLIPLRTRLDSSQPRSGGMPPFGTLQRANKVQTLHYGHGVHGVYAARYSPRGDRIATASEHSVRVWDSNDGRPLVKVDTRLISAYNNGLLWCNDHLFVASGGKIQQIDASTESKISEWPIPNSDDRSCIALSQHGEFIAYSTEHSVTFWDTATGTQISHIQYSHGIGPITLSR